MNVFCIHRKGAALIITMVAFIVALGTMVALNMVLQSTHQGITHIIANKGQAVNIAQAGLMDALNWFRRAAADRQSRFYPKRDYLTDPNNPVDETDDAIIGLVREHVLSEKPYLVGRYEIRRRYYNSTYPDDPNQEDGNPASGYHSIDENGVRDIKEQRKSAKSIFYVESHGYIFTPKDKSSYTPTKFYKTNTQSLTAPDGTTRYKPLINQYNMDEVTIHSKATAVCEIMQQQINLPYPAAICYRGRLTVNKRGTVQTLTPTASKTTARDPLATAPTSSNGGTLDPSGATNNIIVQGTYGTYKDAIEDVFGTLDEQSLAEGPDTVVYSDVSDMELREYKITFLGDHSNNTLPTFTIDSKIRGTSAILYVKGNLVVEANTNFSLSGLLYVVGTLTLKDTAYISGCVVVQNRRVSSSIYDQTSLVDGNFDAATVVYQPEVIEDLRKMMGQYSFYVPPSLKEIQDEKNMNYSDYDS